MKIDEIISKAELFAMNFIAKINDKSEQAARKQTYFLDNQEELQKYMNALQKIIDSINEDGEQQDSEERNILDRAENLVDKIRLAITEYQKELIINNNVSEEETTALLTHESLDDAMKNNKVTQEISANMTAIAEQQKITSQIDYNYALICDGQIHMIAAIDKTQLNDSINSIVNSDNYKDVHLYKMQFTPVPLKKQTVLTVQGG